MEPSNQTLPTIYAVEMPSKLTEIVLKNNIPFILLNGLQERKQMVLMTPASFTQVNTAILTCKILAMVEADDRTKKMYKQLSDTKYLCKGISFSILKHCLRFKAEPLSRRLRKQIITAKNVTADNLETFATGFLIPKFKEIQEQAWKTYRQDVSKSDDEML